MNIIDTIVNKIPVQSVTDPVAMTTEIIQNVASSNFYFTTFLDIFQGSKLFTLNEVYIIKKKLFRNGI
jgi:hypothetical protein